MTEHIIKFIRLKPNAIMPTYQTEQAAAMDMYACLDAPITLTPMMRVVVPMGFAMELPEGYEAQVRARSGLSIKNGISMANGIGTIDADYRGEVGAIVINLGDQDFVIVPEMRIAQMVIAKYEHVSWKEVKTLTVTDRGEGGYGSTGTHQKA